MIKTTVTIVFLALFNNLHSQENFNIKSVGSSYSLEFLTEAFNKANFCGMFYQSENRIIILDDGSEVELLSADSISETDQSCICEKRIVDQVDSWRLTDSGHILRVIPTTGSKK